MHAFQARSTVAVVQCSGTSDGLVPVTFYSYSEALRIVFVSLGLRSWRWNSAAAVAEIVQ
jgi:hypothetical protein